MSKLTGLFDVQVPAISRHLKNIFESGELNENMVQLKENFKQTKQSTKKIHDKRFCYW